VSPAGKIIATVFWDKTGVIHELLAHVNNSELLTAILKQKEVRMHAFVRASHHKKYHQATPTLQS